LSKLKQKKAVHRINLPRTVIVGETILTKLSDICKEQHFNTALIVTGKTTYKIAGKETEEILEASNIPSNCKFIKDATLETVESVIKAVQKQEAEVVIGVGGGRNIDVAKLAAAKTERFFISVPTVASHDGIASSLASVKGMERPYTVKATSPIAVVIDSAIISESPYRFTASGCGDVISKTVEVEDWRLAHIENGDYYGAYAGSLSLMSSVHVMNSATIIRDRTQEGIRTLLEALVSCGVAMSIAGSSRPTSGSSHLFSHALDQISDSPALHGEQCGLGVIMMSKLHGQDWREIKRSLEVIGAPVNAQQLGFEEETIINALTNASCIRPERYTILSKIKLDQDKAKKLAKETGII
jgi:glycerol-1-phosphate dehydrogenase [NAD(P)+]